MLCYKWAATIAHRGASAGCRARTTRPQAVMTLILAPMEGLLDHTLRDVLTRVIYAARVDLQIGVIGVVNNEEMGQPRLITYSPLQALGEAVDETGHIIARTGQFLQRFVAGREDRCQLGGPVKIADMAGKAAQLGFVWLVQLVALLSVGIGILNLLPIPPLDGGHLVFYGIEAVMRRPVSERVMEGVYRVGLLVVLMFMAFVFWNDLFGC